MRHRMSPVETGVLDPADVAAAFGDLPTLAPVAVELVRLADDDLASLEDIAETISRDPALASQMLRVANSAVYGMGGRTTSLTRAASILGLRTVKLLSLTFSVIARPDRSEAGSVLLWRHTLATSALARTIATNRDPQVADECFVVGLLGDLGRMALADHLAYWDASSTASHVLDASEEREAVGCTSDEVTAHILDNWGLPAILGDAVRHRSDPDQTHGPAARVARVLNVADAAARLVIADSDHSGAALEQYHRSALAHLDLTDGEAERMIIEATPALEEIATMFRTEQPHDVPVETLLARAKESQTRLDLDVVAALSREQLRAEQLEAQNARLAAQTLTDALTALPNRRAYEAFVERAVAARRRREATSVLGLLMLDLDEFKAVNDTYGHAVGDEVLRRVGVRLTQHVRRDEFVARVGGEEFVMVTEVADRDEIALVAERMRAALASEPIETAIGPLSVTASVGAALLADVGPSAGQRLYEAADAALIEAKMGGRDRVVVEPTP